ASRGTGSGVAVDEARLLELADHRLVSRRGDDAGREIVGEVGRELFMAQPVRIAPCLEQRGGELPDRVVTGEEDGPAFLKRRHEIAGIRIEAALVRRIADV